MGSLQECPVDTDVSQGSIICPTRFVCYTFMTLLAMISATLLSMLMILLSTLTVIRHLICPKNWIWPLTLNLTYETLWSRAGSCWLTLLLEGSVLEKKNHLLRCWDCLSLLNWIGAPTLSLLLKLPPRKLNPLFIQWSFFLVRLFFSYISLPNW